MYNVWMDVACTLCRTRDGLPCRFLCSCSVCSLWLSISLRWEEDKLRGLLSVRSTWMEHEVTAIACQQRVQEDRFTEAAEAPPTGGGKL